MALKIRFLFTVKTFHVVITAVVEMGYQNNALLGCCRCKTLEQKLPEDAKSQPILTHNVEVRSAHSSVGGDLQLKHLLGMRVVDHIEQMFCHEKGLCRKCYDLILQVNNVELLELPP